MDERSAYIALNMMEKVGPITVSRLFSVFGDILSIFKASTKDLLQVDGIGPKLADHIARQSSSVQWEQEIARAEKLGVSILTPLDDSYPQALRDIYDPPLALYVRGTLLSGDKHAVALVGTRRPSHYGQASAQGLSSALAASGVTIVSGLALGIDTAAHRAALDAGGRTLAVLGSALDEFYPRENLSLATEISNSGAVISEFPFGKKPDKTTFPIRNRIVSGLSEGVVVIEAGVKSGAMITANQAAEQGKQIFAVPGRIDHHFAAGPHQLLRDGAVLVEKAADIINELPQMRINEMNVLKGSDSPDFTGNLSKNEQSILSALGLDILNIDELTRETGLTSGDVSSLLIGLEIKNLVAIRPGRQVERILPTQG